MQETNVTTVHFNRIQTEQVFTLQIDQKKISWQIDVFFLLSESLSLSLSDHINRFTAHTFS